MPGLFLFLTTLEAADPTREGEFIDIGRQELEYPQTAPIEFPV